MSGELSADYVRQLEDACLALWHELPTEQVLLLREEQPRLMDFLAHLHHSIEHEQAMVRQSVWAEPEERTDG
jgi:hypothetical protein